MKKKKIINIIIWVLAFLIILNSIIAFVSYNEVCKKKEPTIKFKIIKKEDITIYKELLYEIRVKEESMTRSVSLKLFFLK